MNKNEFIEKVMIASFPQIMNEIQLMAKEDRLDDVRKEVDELIVHYYVHALQLYDFLNND